LTVPHPVRAGLSRKRNPRRCSPGRSRDIAGDFTIEEVAQDAIATADHLGWDDFHIIGHSMGGKAAQKVAIDGGARIKSTIAVTPVPAPPMLVDSDTFISSPVCATAATPRSI
jgi:pimeloyl-ACP methyl ester carboxylesterase